MPRCAKQRALEGAAQCAQLDELGFKGFGPYVWTGTFLRTAETPPAVVAKLNDAFAKALANPEVIVKSRSWGDAAQCRAGPIPAMVKQDSEQWGSAIRKLGIAKS